MVKRLYIYLYAPKYDFLNLGFSSEVENISWWEYSNVTTNSLRNILIPCNTNVIYLKPFEKFLSNVENPFTSRFKRGAKLLPEMKAASECRNVILMFVKSLSIILILVAVIFAWQPIWKAACVGHSLNYKAYLATRV